MYDPRVGRWLSLDPLMQKFPSESPYLYTGGNPIIFTDPDGKARILTITILTDKGRYTVLQVSDDRRVYVEARKYFGAWAFRKHDLNVEYTIDLRTKDRGREVITKQETWSNGRDVGIFDWIGAGIGIAPETIRKREFGYVLTGNDAGTSWDLTSDANVKEHLDLGLLGSAFSSWRDVAATGKSSVFPELHDALAELAKDKKVSSELIKQLLNFADKIDDVSDATDALRSANGGTFPLPFKKELPPDMVKALEEQKASRIEPGKAKRVTIIYPAIRSSWRMDTAIWMHHPYHGGSDTIFKQPYYKSKSNQ